MCSETECNMALPTLIQPQANSVERHKRNATQEQKNALKELLQDYQKKLESQCPAYFLLLQAATGFTDLSMSIQTVVKNTTKIFNLDKC